ncbi:NAD(P)-dependent oxidoreductase [Halorubrum vacuolatum]|uniref:3-hydroxyisobutyrate dehydrogenase/2-hydroxymethylglutarate dehydrogenase n=1 Tax=Halorubrum vacuolatum TaxID=63740 RepID=A0A238Y7Y1_HALVU|nr:NAD(P)-dependent oxidoreductase [Halorubrum vacuolatum]SNR66753.1 3-hydroxyisobutyrate dehydrogenase/2-hydroxymethylglutarate dehydrogenase [Halorubrum vacuolatum]
MSDTTVGVVGLGKMGGNMAKHLFDESFEVYGHDVQPEVRESFAEYGGTVAESARDVARQSDVTITSLPTSQIVEDVYTGDGGLAHESVETIFLEMSTIAPPTTETLAAAVGKTPSEILDAPITGGPEDSRQGTLTGLVGGKKPVFESEPPQEVLNALCAEVHYAGDSGSGHAIKLLNNTMSMGNLLLAMETVALGSRYGIDGDRLWDILGNASATSVAFESRMPRVLERDFEAGFTIDFARKDIGLAVEMADAEDYPMLMGGMVHRLYTQASNEGFGEDDVGAVLKMFEEREGDRIGDDPEK